MSKVHPAAAPLAALALLAAGCGGRGELSGKVTLTDQGKTRALAMGSVMVLASDGKPYYGQIGADGTYRVSGVPTGEAVVTVTSVDPGASAAGAALVGRRDPGKAKAPTRADRSKWIPVPEKYTSPATTDLKVTIRSGENPFDLKLTR